MDKLVDKKNASVDRRTTWAFGFGMRTADCGLVWEENKAVDLFADVVGETEKVEGSRLGDLVGRAGLDLGGF